MPDYRRAYVPGGTFFLRFVTFERQRLLAEPHDIARLRRAIAITSTTPGQAWFGELLPPVAALQLHAMGAAGRIRGRLVLRLRGAAGFGSGLFRYRRYHWRVTSVFRACGQRKQIRVVGSAHPTTTGYSGLATGRIWGSLCRRLLPPSVAVG